MKGSVSSVFSLHFEENIVFFSYLTTSYCGQVDEISISAAHFGIQLFSAYIHIVTIVKFQGVCYTNYVSFAVFCRIFQFGNILV